MTTSVITDLLAAYYADADPTRLPIIADALEEAGATDYARWLRSAAVERDGHITCRACIGREILAVEVFESQAKLELMGHVRCRMPATTCSHAAIGLCPSCQADYDEDPSAWEEYGQHPAGIARSEALQREIAEDARRPDGPVAESSDPSIPF